MSTVTTNVAPVAAVSAAPAPTAAAAPTVAAPTVAASALTATAPTVAAAPVTVPAPAPSAAPPTTPARARLVREDARFPQRCLDIEPVVANLNVLGDATILNKPALAIVGARKATPYGLSCARHFAALAADKGLMVVSGGAIGCDQAAHRGALHAEGRTVVVLGCGADVVYPRKAAGLFAEVLAAGGAIVSEAPWGSPPSRFGFRRRNRIIAALGMATLIVEAGLPSGTFSTADATLALGREVLVVPGSIRSRESEGSNRLLLQGALPVVNDESFLDYLSEIIGATLFCGSVSGRGALPDLNGIERALMAQPMTVEEVATYRECDVTAAIRDLSALEFAGTITRLRDGRYAIREQKHYY
jgi:DNA processing protein